MSKRFSIFVIFSISALLYGEEISLDSLLEQLDSTFYQREIFENKKEFNTIKKDTLRLREYNGVQSNYNLSQESKSSKNFESTGEIKYGNFYIKGSKSKNKDIFGFGVEKNLKDLIYSKYDSDLKKLFYEENKDRVQYLKKLQLEKISLINLYKDIKDVESEIIIKSNALKVLREQKNVLDNSYKLGKVSKIDLESSIYNYENTSMELDYLRNQLKILKKQFFYKYNIDINNFKLKKIDNNNSKKINIEKIDQLDLRELELEENILKETIKYQEYSNKVPDIALGLEKYDDNKIVLKFSKKLFYRDINLMDDMNEVIRKKMLVKQKRNDLESVKYEIQNNISDYNKEILVLKNRQYLEEKIYNIKLLENKHGKTKYIDVIEAFDKYIKTSVNLEKEINKLNAYLYIVKVRGEEL